MHKEIPGVSYWYNPDHGIWCAAIVDDAGQYHQMKTAGTKTLIIKEAIKLSQMKQLNG